MACKTTDLSIDFSRATASAICKSSSLLALTAGSAIVFTPLRDFVFINFSTVAIALPGQTGTRRFDQFIGQHQMSAANVGERHAHQEGFASTFGIFDEEAHLAIVISLN